MQVCVSLSIMSDVQILCNCVRVGCAPEEAGKG